MKVCCRCKESLPFYDFNRASSTKDGLQRACKACIAEYGRTPEAKARAKARSARRWKENKEAMAAVNKAWYAENYPRIRERRVRQAMAWNKANPEKRREIVTRRRMAKRSIESERIDRAAVYERDGFKCHICEKHVPPGERTLDHLIPLSRGGKHRADNVRLAHHRCNCRRGPGRIDAQLLLVG